MVQLGLSRNALQYSKISWSSQYKVAKADRQKRYRATTLGKAAVKRYATSATGKASSKRYKASPLGKAAKARANAKVLAKIKEEREAWKAWLASLTPARRKLVLAREKAIKAANSRKWGGAKILANAVCAALAAKLETDARAWLYSIFARKKVGKEIICADGGWANSAIRMKMVRGLAFHATAVSPYALELVGGKPFMLRPSRKEGAFGASYVYFSLSNDPSLPVQFVEAHHGKCYVSNAIRAPALHSVYLYVFDASHAQYGDFHQLFCAGGTIKQCMRFFARCRLPVNVAPGTPGVAVLRIFWEAGAPMDPHVEVVYGQVEIPTMPLPEWMVELRAIMRRSRLGRSKYLIAKLVCQRALTLAYFSRELLRASALPSASFASTAEALSLAYLRATL